MKAIITFQGFTESNEHPSGTEDLYFEVLEKFTEPEKVTVYQPWRWNSKIEVLFAQLMRQRIHDVILVGYSWGAGYTCMRFGKLAREYGVRIPLALLCDPVYRPTWMPRWLPANPLNIYSLDINSKIKLPPSIKRVAYVRQENSIPHGHEVVATNFTQVIHEPKVLNYSHCGIDEAPEWFSLVKNELELELKSC